MFKKNMNSNFLLPGSTQGSNAKNENIQKPNLYDAHPKYLKKL